MFKDFSWGIVAAVALGVLLIGIVMKAVTPSLPANFQGYVPNSLKS